MVGIANPVADLTPWHSYLDEIVAIEKSSVGTAGATTVEFGILSMSDEPYSYEDVKRSLINRDPSQIVSNWRQYTSNLVA